MMHFRFVLIISLALLGAAIVAALFGVSLSQKTLVMEFAPDMLHQVALGFHQADSMGVEQDGRIRAVIVPHHLVSPQSIALGIRSLTKTGGSLLLISPDHFKRCPTLLCTAQGEVETPTGAVSMDAGAVEHLSRSALVTLHPRLFREEHGISSVLPFIAHSLPGRKVIPLVVSQVPMNKEQEGEFAALIAGLSQAGHPIIVSSDFSHYLPLQEADAMDEKTAKTLFSGDLSGILALQNPSQSDCPRCLWALSSVALEGGFFNPSILSHTNSARILGDASVKETTSHFAMVWYQNDALTPADAAFAGDVTVTRDKVAPSLSKDMAQFWNGTGMRVANLEGPLAKECVPQENPFLFCNLVSVWSGIRLLATHWVLANNHMFDRGPDGVQETETLLHEQGEIPVVSPFAEYGNVRIFPLTLLQNPVEGMPEGFIGKEKRKVMQALASHKDGKMNVVFVHAGDEYNALVSSAWRETLRAFIDAGADAVVAVHSHVPSDMELYRGHPIFMGVGNFLFDQFQSQPTMTAKAVRLRKEGGRILFETKLARGRR
jgi:poly-gamma-glutamate synthesis protein (capsule biosynthesis protein)